MNLENTIKEGSKILKKNNIKSHELDAEIILANIIGLEREYLNTIGQKNISTKNKEKFDVAIQRRVKYEPIAYITGNKEFWNENFLVNRSTLGPRPETELLIYKIIKYFKFKSLNILDIGTGSGCILLTILKELNHAKGVGIDISAKAIWTATKNSEKLQLTHRSKFKVCNLKDLRAKKYDLVVSNPPYILSKDIKKLSKDIINFEPRVALDGGVDGLDLIKKVIYKSNYLLKRKGILALEIVYNQYRKVSKILKYYRFREMAKEYDYNRNVRCIISTKLD